MNQQYVILKSDTGDTGNYICDGYAVILNNLESKSTGPRVRLPKNSIVRPNKQINLPLPNFPSKGKNTHLFNKLKSASLLSIGHL